MSTQLYSLAQCIDAPVILNTAVNNIPGSASLPYQVIASTTALITRVAWGDDTNESIGVYIGAVGLEVRLDIVRGPSGTFDCVIPPGSRVSVKNESSNVISSGTLVLKFYKPVAQGSGVGQYKL